MHFNFAFTTVQTLWTLTFAALLVLLVVILGRDRAHRFPWFTASIVLVALRLISSRLLYGRLPQLTMSVIFIVMADLSALIGLLVAVEVARRAFGRAQRRTWIASGLLLLAVGGIVLWKWGPWPAWKTLAFDTPMAKLSLMQLLALKTGLLADVLNVALGVLIVAFGRRYGAGWRSHVQQIAIGLSTASLGQMGAQGFWQIIVHTAAPHSQTDYLRVVGLRDKLFNANSVVYIAVVVWWIVCLWIDEPGTAHAAVALTDGVEAPPDEAPVDGALPKEPEE